MLIIFTFQAIIIIIILNRFNIAISDPEEVKDRIERRGDAREQLTPSLSSRLLLSAWKRRARDNLSLGGSENLPHPSRSRSLFFLRSRTRT